MMSNDQYKSLYDYRGQASRQSGLGKQVNDAAKAKGIKIIYEPLPEHLVREEYKMVATYPVSFLDEYFGNESKPDVSSATQADIMQRLLKLEQQVAELLKYTQQHVTNINEYDDDLPF
jgi:hypothetical protein